MGLRRNPLPPCILARNKVARTRLEEPLMMKDLYSALRTAPQGATLSANLDRADIARLRAMAVAIGKERDLSISITIDAPRLRLGQDGRLPRPVTITIG